MRKAGGNFDVKINSLNEFIKDELNWWLESISKAMDDILLPEVNFIINTDASESGWGATDNISLLEEYGTKKDKECHINYLKLKAIYLAIKAYRSSREVCKYIRIRSDNTTAIAYINNMEDLVSNSCNHLAKETWKYCTDQKIWLYPFNIPGKDNNTADYMSRLLNENTEWRLAPFVFQEIVNLFKVTPEIDLFASALNHQVPKYFSWHPDQEVFAIDAFSISWANIKFHAFPSFNLIGTSISKIKGERASGIMIIPLWNTQFWFPIMVSLLQDFPVILPPKVLALPFNQDQQHPVLAVHFPAHPSDIQTFHQKLQMLSWSHGYQPQGQDMSLYSEDGTAL